MLSFRLSLTGWKTMADLTKFKRRSSLGEPPPPAEASANLDAAETAPAPATPTAAPVRRMTVVRSVKPAAGEGSTRRDGRSARRSGRTLQFATRVSPEFDDMLRGIAERDHKLLVEVLEEALEAYEQSRHRQSSR
jgi:hypothetical protein